MSSDGQVTYEVFLRVSPRNGEWLVILEEASHPSAHYLRSECVTLARFDCEESAHAYVREWFKLARNMPEDREEVRRG
jgi:hypothetical protein